MRIRTFDGFRRCLRLLLLVAGMTAVIGPKGTLAETCVKHAGVEICMDPAETAKLVDPDALKRLFSTKAAVFQKKIMENRVAVAHPHARSLAKRWNKIAAEVLKDPGERDAFYQTFFESLELQEPMKLRLESAPVFHIAGLPNAPRASFIPSGLNEIMKVDGTEELPRDNQEAAVAMLNAMFEANGAWARMIDMYNVVPLLAEFVYQLRHIYRSQQKQVVVFEDKPGGSSPEVDLLGTLYVPRSFFDQFDSAEQHVILVHEATHLKAPAGQQLMRLISTRKQLGPLSDMAKTPEFSDRLAKFKMDKEYEHDAAVLLHLRSRPDLRRRYESLLRRLEPTSQRAAIIGYLNQSIESGKWPRPITSLSLSEIAPLLQAYAQYDRLPDGPEKAASIVPVMELLVTVLPKEEQVFYRPLFQLILKQQIQNPEKLVHDAGLEPDPEDRETLAEGISLVFEEVLKRWEQ